jgi:prolyl-tRNA editing enzyme YbaK/EbsC (Cys-tRNA(Pro) deacylase)
VDKRNSRVAAAQQLGCEVGAIANSLVFDCDGEPLLVMASGADRVDTELLARALGAAAINKANPQFVRSATGQVIGGVAPTGTQGEALRVRRSPGSDSVARSRAKRACP